MKRTLSLFIVSVLALTLCTSLIGCSPTDLLTEEAATEEGVEEASQEPVAEAPVIETADFGAIGRGHIEALTDIGPRVAGTEADTQAAEYIAGVFESFGYATETQPFSETDDYGETVDSANVVAVKPGNSPLEIILGAHYDSAEDSLGADDDASGVAAMLEVAELVSDQATPYTIRFIAFGAEEAGLLGSYAYLDQMSKADLENTIAMINLDSLVAGDIAYIYSDEGDQAALRDWTLQWAFGDGIDLQTIHNVDLSEEDGSGSSDYAAFLDAGIPFIYFETTNWNLGAQDGYTQVDPQYGEQGEIRHTSYDTLEYLDSTFPGRVDQHLDLFVRVLYHILTQYE